MAEGPTLASLENESAADTMRGVLAEMDGAEALSPSTSTETVETPTTTTTETVGTGEKTATERARDEKGRFTKAEQEAADKAALEAGGTGKAALKSEDGKEPIEAAEPSDIEPPHEWTLVQQTEFRKLSPQLKEFVSAQADIGRAAAQAQHRYQAFDAMLSPHRQAWAVDGLDDIGGVKRLLAISEYADKKPGEFLTWFMEQRGLTLDTDTAADPGKVAEGDDFDDPVIKRLQATITGQQQRLDRLETGIQTRAGSARQQEINQVASELVSFRDAKDEKGRLKHPYMADKRIRQGMSAMLRSGLAPDHMTAYDMACRADPEVSAKIAASAEAERERERAAAQRTKAEAARRAGSSITGTPGDRATPALNGDPREDLRQVMAEAGLLRTG